jgi:hypothetical protein
MCPRRNNHNPVVRNLKYWLNLFELVAEDVNVHKIIFSPQSALYGYIFEYDPYFHRYKPRIYFKGRLIKSYS